jgi:hypothetical protein
MAAYNREWVVWPGDDARLPRESRMRFGYTRCDGELLRFVVQLEYWYEETWLQVARFEHQADGPSYRNVEQDGLHLDLYNPDGEQVEKVTWWMPQPANEAMGDADDYLRKHAESLVRRFERWL